MLELLSPLIADRCAELGTDAGKKGCASASIEVVSWDARVELREAEEGRRRDADLPGDQAAVAVSSGCKVAMTPFFAFHVPALRMRLGFGVAGSMCSNIP